MAESKTRYWEGHLYPENMRPDWQEELPELIKLPFAYCVHDMDAGSDGAARKVHVHLILAWAGPTTYANAYRVFLKLQSEDKDPATNPCIHRIEMVDNMRCSYDYLIHDTDDARKRGKYQYPPECRIQGNGFDIGFYEQLSLEEKAEIFEDMVDHIIELGIYNMVDLRFWIMEQGDRAKQYKEAVRSFNAPTQRYLDAVYQKKIYVTGKEKLDRLHDLAQGTEGDENEG